MVSLLSVTIRLPPRITPPVKDKLPMMLMSPGVCKTPEPSKIQEDELALIVTLSTRLI